MFKLRQDKLPPLSRYRYRINEFKEIDALTDESALELNTCSYGYNISFRGSVLTGSVGVNEARLPIMKDYLGETVYTTLPMLDEASFKYIHYYKSNVEDEGSFVYDKIFALGSDGYVYYMALAAENWYKTQIKSTQKEVSFINYFFNGKNTLIICLKEGGMYLYNDLTDDFDFYDTPPISSPCIHYERLFGTNGSDTVYFSNDLDPTDFEISNTGAGFIRLVDEEGGRILRLVTYGDCIYIFREHSVYRLNAYSDPTDYRLTKVFETDQLIIKDTIVATTENMLFVADDTLYSFNGYSVHRVLPKVMACVESFKEAKASYYKNKCYLSVRLKSRDNDKVGDENLSPSFKNNGMIIFSILSGAVEIFRGTDIGMLMPVVFKEMNSLLCTFSNFRGQRLGIIDQTGTLFGVPLKKLWISPMTYFNMPDVHKRIKRLYINSLYPLQLRIKSDSDSIEKCVYGSKIATLVPLSCTGNSFSIELEAVGDRFFITNILLEMDFARRYYAN